MDADGLDNELLPDLRETPGTATDVKRARPAAPDARQIEAGVAAGNSSVEYSGNPVSPAVASGRRTLHAAALTATG